MDNIDNIASQQQQLGQLDDEMAWHLHCALAHQQAGSPDVDAAWQRFERRAGCRARHLPLWRVAAVAAAAAAVVGIFVQYFSRHSNHPGPLTAITVLEQSDADTTGVTMTRELTAWDAAAMSPATKNQQKTTTKVVTTDSISFASSDDDSELAASVVLMTTPRGKDCRLTLSDGTRVWMNADSRLQFPEQFGTQKRVVRLSGEAYFEVAKDSCRPFVVESSFMTATVLGTTFNMRVYSASDASVALVEGRVAVAPANGGQPVTVSPGQQIALSPDHTSLTLSVADTYGFTQRKDGFFYFHNATMRQIMTELGRWYNKTVVFEDADLMDMRLHFVAERTLSLPQVINRLSEIDGVDITLGPDDITVR
mgnify:CR=1 FL=1